MKGEAPLAGTKVVELAGIGPAPHACMVLADLGADVVRVQQPGHRGHPMFEKGDPTLRGRRVIELDLKSAQGRRDLRSILATADVLIEGFRPGVLERIGLDPVDLLTTSPALVVGRMTGWGQTGEWALAAGHDINYLAVTGILDAMGPAGGPPSPPLNLVGDFGGGSMFLVVGILAALLERSRSGRGQIIDAAMVDGVSALAQMIWALRHNDAWQTGRGENLLDGSHPFYRAYECRDRRFVAVGAIEEDFYDAFVAGLGIDRSTLPGQWDRHRWDELAGAFAKALATRDRDDWVDQFSGSDACVSPVYTLDEAAEQEPLRSRGSVLDVGGLVQAAPAPRFSRSTTIAPRRPIPDVVPVEQIIQRWSQETS